MRQILKRAREQAGTTQKEIADKLGVSERYYQHIESGSREGKGWLWDELEALFQIPQRQLREDDAQDDYTAPAPRAGAGMKEAVQAAAELSEVSSSEMVRAALDFTDGRAPGLGPDADHRRGGDGVGGDLWRAS